VVVEPEGKVVASGDEVVALDEDVVVLAGDAVAVVGDDGGALNDVDDDTADNVVAVGVGVDVLATADGSVTCRVVVSELFVETASREAVAVATTL